MPNRGRCVSACLCAGWQVHSQSLRAFYQRINARRGFQTPVVATARKMTVLAWHLATRDQDYAFAGPPWSSTNGASSNSRRANVSCYGTRKARQRLVDSC